VISEDDTRDLNLLKSDIALRLAPVCSHFPATEFAELIDQIARIELKYARRAASTAPAESP
jgi:hypothetical protein